MKGFDLKGLEPYVDWVNVMAYDLHGSWEKPTIAEPHTNLSDIQQSLQLVWDAGVSPGKVILGLADYGKTYTLSSGSCTKPGCAATGPGLAGPCSNEAGSLHNAEIDAILKKHTDIKPQLDKKAAVKYFSWDNTQWLVKKVMADQIHLHDRDADLYYLYVGYRMMTKRHGSSKSNMLQISVWQGLWSGL